MTARRRLHELTFRGWADKISYRIRRLFIDPAPEHDRCIMGYPIGEDVRCPRRALPGDLWCPHHHPEVRES